MRKPILFALPLLLILVAGMVRADPPAGDAPMTRAQGNAILAELRRIRELLEHPPSQVQRPEPPPMPGAPAGRAPAPPVHADVPLAGGPVLGEPDAPVTMVEFMDFQCPYCRRFFRTTWPALKHRYVDPGRVRLVVRDLPMPFHHRARKAAQAAHCAGDQGKYWPMFDKLFGGGLGIHEDALLKYAQQIGLDAKTFRACLDSDKHLAEIDASASAAMNAGINGTPAFVIGHEKHGRVEGVHIRGALPLRVFEKPIDRLLNPPPEAGKP